MEEFTVFGVALALAVKRIVDWMKARGMDKKHAPILAVVVAAVLLGCNEAASLSPAFMEWYERVWTVLFYALVASEVYDVQHSLERRANGA